MSTWTDSLASAYLAGEPPPAVNIKLCRRLSSLRLYSVCHHDCPLHAPFHRQFTMGHICPNTASWRPAVHICDQPTRACCLFRSHGQPTATGVLLSVDQSRGTVYPWYCVQVTSRRRVSAFRRHFCLTLLTISYVDSYRDINSYFNMLSSLPTAHLWPLRYINVLNNIIITMTDHFRLLPRASENSGLERKSDQTKAVRRQCPDGRPTVNRLTCAL